jgi:hypothetical protein
VTLRSSIAGLFRRCPVVVWVVFAVISGDSKAASFETNSIEGWRVLVDEKLLKHEKAATEKAVELLRIQLKEIVRTGPGRSVA